MNPCNTNNTIIFNARQMLHTIGRTFFKKCTSCQKPIELLSVVFISATPHGS